MALFRYLVPSVKYWAFDRHDLAMEHVGRMAEAEWLELERSTARVLEVVEARQDGVVVEL
ncbi:MAG: hypothetical protein ABMA64_00255 [Myxococcota bacterium]